MRILFMAMAFVLAMMPSVNAAVYQQGIVYVIYDEEEADFVKDRTDINANGVPDMVEDIATQLNASRELFNDFFDFPDPLKSERFGNVTAIEVDIRAAEFLGEYNGKSSRKVREQAKHDPSKRVIYFSVANNVKPHNQQTATHEYFHLLQYGATYFRNNWFKEGMARWAQDAIRQKKEYPDGANVPFMLEDESANEVVFKGSYDMAEQFWYPLAVNMDDKVTIPDRLINKYRYVDGSPVFKDNIIYGPNVMRAVLIKMKSKEEVAAAEEFGSLTEWRRRGQRDKRNNKFIMECVREVYYGKLQDGCRWKNFFCGI